MLPIEPDDICIRVHYWEDIYIPELAQPALDFINQYEQWELDIWTAASAMHALDDIELN